MGKGLNELLCASWGIGQGTEYPSTIKKKSKENITERIEKKTESIFDITVSEIPPSTLRGMKLSRHEYICMA